MPLFSVFSNCKRTIEPFPKDIVKQGMKISKVWEKHKSLWSHFSGFALKIALNVILEGFVPLK